VLEDEFIDLVIIELKNLWPECQMVRGSPRHSESNGGVERVNQTVQRKLGGWMKTNATKHWSVGCKIVQWRVNTQFHRTLKDTPYHLVYGMHPRVGISNLPISQSVLNKLVTEAQLNEVYCEMAEDPPSQDNAKLPESFQDQVAAVADAANAEAMVSLSPVQTKRKRPPEDSNTSMMDLTQVQQAMRDARVMKIAKSDALKEAVLSRSAKKPSSPPTTPPNDSAGRLKRAEGTNINNCWLELYKE
jgi:hypothetical protein